MQTVRSKLAKTVFLAACIAPFAFSAAAAEKSASACGTEPPAYTADRTIHTPDGPMKTKFYHNGPLQREDQNKDVYRITDLDKSVVYTVNLKTKTVEEKDMPDNQADTEKLKKEAYFDRKPQDDGTTLVESRREAKDGKKEWLDRTVCGADGIFVQRELKVPGPDKKMVMIKIVQENIKVGDVPASLFEIPDGLKKEIAAAAADAGSPFLRRRTGEQRLDGV